MVSIVCRILKNSLWKQFISKLKIYLDLTPGNSVAKSNTTPPQNNSNSIVLIVLNLDLTPPPNTPTKHHFNGFKLFNIVNAYFICKQTIFDWTISFFRLLVIIMINKAIFSLIQKNIKIIVWWGIFFHLSCLMGVYVLNFTRNEKLFFLLDVVF